MSNKIDRLKKELVVAAKYEQSRQNKYDKMRKRIEEIRVEEEKLTEELDLMNRTFPSDKKTTTQIQREILECISDDLLEEGKIAERVLNPVFC